STPRDDCRLSSVVDPGCAPAILFLVIRRPPRSTLFPTRRSSDLPELPAQIPDTWQEIPKDDLALKDNPANPGSSAMILERQVYTDRKSTRLNSSHVAISYAVFCLKKKKSTSPKPNPAECPDRLPP